MTHDELQAKLNAMSDSDTVHALRAVVELHKPEGINAPAQCAHDFKIYPCPTIRKITEQLK